MGSWSERLVTIPPGRHPFPREFVTAHQRERILSATTELVAKRGYHGTSIDLITKTARVALATFYEIFDTKQDCFVAAFDDAAAAARDDLRLAIDGRDTWPDQIAAGLGAFLDLIVANPAKARMCLVEAQGAAPILLGRYQQARDSCVPKLREGRELAVGKRLPDSTEQTILGGIVWVLHRRIVRGEFDQLREELFPEFLRIILRPYLGTAEAERLVGAASERFGSPAS